MQSLSSVTWNVRGIHTQSKRIKIINHLSKLKADILYNYTASQISTIRFEFSSICHSLLLTNAYINHKAFTLTNIYCPNNNNPSFFSILCDSTNIIMAGDFSTIIIAHS
uniref:Endonuclease/exonuclease/phosphatase domain-containing protein n=1 Tax=Seriola lalandi dorsalis TaxID=1841481 RepID=A0A3B4XX78_SERLL